MRVEIGVNRGERAEEQTADVGKGAGAAGRDASLGEQGVEGAEGMVDALSVLEAASVLGQRDHEVLGVRRL